MDILCILLLIKNVENFRKTICLRVSMCYNLINIDYFLEYSQNLLELRSYLYG